MKSTIELEINSIFQSLVSRLSDDYVVVREQPSRYASCNAIISVYDREEMKCNGYDVPVVGKNRVTDADSVKVRKPIKLNAKVRYVFYGSIYSPDKLGSVAIYGGNAVTRNMMINARNTLFGRKVLSSRVETGVRPFVDVRFAV